MVKDRKTLLKQMYDGEFNPNETVISSDPDYVSMSHQEGEEIEYIASRLTAEDIANGVFTHVRDLPRQEPRKSSSLEPTYTPAPAP